MMKVFHLNLIKFLIWSYFSFIFIFILLIFHTFSILLFFFKFHNFMFAATF